MGDKNLHSPRRKDVTSWQMSEAFVWKMLESITWPACFFRNIVKPDGAFYIDADPPAYHSELWK